MPRAVAIAALLGFVACVEEPDRDLPMATSHVQVAEYLEHPPPVIDVLVVVDNTSAMAQYQAKLPQLTANLAAVIGTLARGMTDLRIAVATDGGGLSPVLSDRVDWFGVHTASFEGSLESAIAPLVDVPTVAGSSQPLAAMRTALESSGTFLREHASLVVVTISAGDDVSPAFDYVSFVRSMKSTDELVLGIYPVPSPNLDAFHGAFPYRNGVVSIGSDDFSPTLAKMNVLPRTTLEASCLTPPADVDLAVPGDQVDCVATAWDDGLELARVPMCTGGDPTTGSCWELRHDPSTGCSNDYVGFALRGMWTWSLRPAIQVQCVTQ